MKVTPNSEQERPRSRVVTKAVPVAVSAAVTLAVVGAAVVAISKREKSPALPETNKVRKYVPSYMFSISLQWSGHQKHATGPTLHKSMSNIMRLDCGLLKILQAVDCNCML